MALRRDVDELRAGSIRNLNVNVKRALPFPRNVPTPKLQSRLAEARTPEYYAHSVPQREHKVGAGRICNGICSQVHKGTRPRWSISLHLEFGERAQEENM